MKNRYVNGLALIAALVVSACAARVQPTSIDDAASWTDIVPLNTMIQISQDGEPVDLNAILASEETLRQALDTLFPEAANIDNLGQRIDSILERKGGDDRPFDVLRGLGGLYAHEFLNSAKAALDGNGNFDPDKRVYEFFYGHTREFEFDSQAGSGRILNFTYFTRVVVGPDNVAIESTTDSYRWEVAVDRGGYSVVEKGSDPNDPFPDTLDFAPAMLNRINALGFEYKLWAKGRAIDIVEIAFKAHGTPTYVPVPRSDPRYDRTDSNCIDMLFVNFPPPTLGTLQPPLYCLGRCDNPMLINTGL